MALVSHLLSARAARYHIMQKRRQLAMALEPSVLRLLHLGVHAERNGFNNNHHVYAIKFVKGLSMYTSESKPDGVICINKV